MDNLREEILDLIREEIVGPRKFRGDESDKFLFQDNKEEILTSKHSPRSRYGAGVLFPKNTVPGSINFRLSGTVNINR